MAWTQWRYDQRGRRHPGQIPVLKMYTRYAGIRDRDYRRILLEHARDGVDPDHPSATNPLLTQRDYERTMAIVEIHAHTAHTNDLAVGCTPACIRDWYYWRKRLPKEGRISNQALRRLKEIWRELCPHLEPEKRGPQHDGGSAYWYLNEIAARALGRYVADLSSLFIWEGIVVTEALKGRLRQEHIAANAAREPA